MNLFYRELGSGKPLIILHGVFGSSDNWLTPAKMLEEDFHIYLLDQRNHGRSFHSEDFTYSHMADDLYNFIKENKISNPHIIGHSMGGKVAMEFAAKYPNELDKLVVVDIAPRYYPPHHGSILEGLNFIDLATLSSRGEADEILSRYVPEKGVRQFLFKNLYRDDDGNYKWRINLPVITEKIENVGEVFSPDKKIEVTSLFINGSASAYIKERDVDQIKEMFKNVEFSTIEGAGHWLQAERPDEFISITKDFLKRTS